MLVTSNTLRGRCPICGAPHCTCGGPTEVVAVDQRMELAGNKGPLRRYELGRGVSVQLTDEAARRAGLLERAGEERGRQPTHNKMRRPGANKGR